MALLKNTPTPNKLFSILFFTLPFLLFSNAAAAQTATFAGRDYPLLGNTHITADFNGDGLLDLAGAGINATVMLGNGDGTFRPKVEYPAGGFTQALAAGDFNGDGKLDLVVTVNDPNVMMTLLTGNGNGAFNAPVSFANTAHLDSPAIVAADFDHDGSLDVIVGHDMACYTAPCIIGRTISLWRGNGDGTFQPSQEIEVGLAASHLAVGDFNRDGNPDLSVAAANAKLYILLGGGDGTFNQQPAITLLPNSSLSASDLDVGDFNGDSIQDLVAAIVGDGGYTVVVVGNGDGSFRTPSVIVEPDLFEPQQQAVADFNGDGKQDLALALGFGVRGLMEILYGRGDGTFQPAVRYFAPPSLLSNGGNVLIAADFNSDGKQDIALEVVGSEQVGTRILLNTTGIAPAPLAFGSLAATPPSVVGTTQAEVNVSLALGAVSPAGSLTFTVSSSTSAVVTVPTRVVLVAGMTNVRFRVDTSRVTSPRTVAISVSNNRIGTRSVSLIVTPATEPLAIGSIQTQPAGVFGGTDGLGIVTLTTGNVAPAGGAQVALGNDNPGLVSMPGSVVIPTGQSSTSFPIHTTQTGVTTSVNISASYGGVTRSAVFTVAAPSAPVAISSVTLSPQNVVGGSNIGVRFTVTLAGPAPPEEAFITLTSSHPAIALVPGSLRIFSRGTTGFADFVTTPVSAPTQVIITAVYGGSSASVVLTITPQASGPALSAIAVNPNPVVGGSAAQGTVTLSTPATTATVVILSTSTAAASVPASVTIPAGATSANFNVGTITVASPVTVTVGATVGGAARSVTLTVTPGTQTGDTVAIQRAEYDSGKRTLRIEATSTRANAMLQVFVTASGQLIGTLTNNGGGRYSGQLSSATNPQNITVRSSLGGSAARVVTLK